MELYPICDESLAVSPNIWYAVSGTGESPFMRVGHTLIHDASQESEGRGSLVIIGGANPSECFRDVYTLDLKTLRWDKFEDAKTFDTGRYEHACFQAEDRKIYIFGGADQEKNFNDIVQVDLKNKLCERAMIENSKGPSPRTIHCAVSFKNQLVVFGGGESGKNAVQDSKVYVFNPMNRKWIGLTIKGEQPETRHGHVMINVNEKFIYLHGGMSGTGIFDDLWKLDLSQMTWTRISFDEGKRPGARAAHGGICVGKFLYIFGGLCVSGTALDDLWKYDTELNEWSEVEVFGYKPPARLDFAYCRLSILNNEIVKETSASGEDEVNEERDAHELLATNKIQELDLLMGNDEKEQGLFKKVLPVSLSSEMRLFNYLVIHGGMDTEGNVHEDCFLINLD